MYAKFGVQTPTIKKNLNPTIYTIMRIIYYRFSLTNIISLTDLRYTILNHILIHIYVIILYLYMVILFNTSSNTLVYKRKEYDYCQAKAKASIKLNSFCDGERHWQTCKDKVVWYCGGSRRTVAEFCCVGWRMVDLKNI